MILYSVVDPTKVVKLSQYLDVRLRTNYLYQLYHHALIKCHIKANSQLLRWTSPMLTIGVFGLLAVASSEPITISLL